MFRIMVGKKIGLHDYATIELANVRAEEMKAVGIKAKVVPTNSKKIFG